MRTPTGKTALLCACYDAFALAEMAIGPTSKRGAMRYVYDKDWDWRWLSEDDRDRLLAAFAELTSEAEPDVVLVGVHGFKRPGREIYWQRHGIATASAALGGTLVVGAAHFRHELPDRRDLARAALASVGVPQSHLRAGLHRRALRLAATDAFVVRVPGSPKLKALVSLVEG